MTYVAYDSMDTVGMYRDGWMDFDEALRRLTQDNGWTVEKAHAWLRPV